jgi:hypothetical protein
MKAPVETRLLARGWWLVGNGPSYLLFRREERRVMHLTKQFPRHLREALKGYQAVENGRLMPQVYDLNLISLLYSPAKGEERRECRKACLKVLSTIDRLIYQSPDKKSFEKRLARFVSDIRAAYSFVAAECEFGGGPNFTWSFDMERSTGWIVDSLGREVMMTCYTDPLRATTGAKYRFRCVPHSPIARVTEALWNREQQNFGGGATSLYRIPDRKELREELLLDEPAVTKLCHAAGFYWLPKASFRKRRKTPRQECRGRAAISALSKAAGKS